MKFPWRVARRSVNIYFGFNPIYITDTDGAIAGDSTATGAPRQRYVTGGGERDHRHDAARDFDELLQIRLDDGVPIYRTEEGGYL